ncbi:MAG: FecR domain-containing protein [Bacteroidetes bacterium]|nr:FecR domain-containing protein [Bacteroidota bacterium]MCL5737094.1 FecR domain-containing protein [Bacteroidota bacterium]
MQQDIDWERLAKYLSGECSEEEKGEVEADKAMMEHVHFFQGHLEALSWQKRKSRTWDIDEALNKVSSTVGIFPVDQFESQRDNHLSPKYIPQPSPSRTSINVLAGLNMMVFARIAAVIVVLLGITYVALNSKGWFYSSDSSHSEFREFSTGRGEQMQLILADGSKVTLNSLTTIRFSRSFGKKSREIQLEGEAYFVVAHDRLPFVVRTKSGTIEDISTEFNVKTWPGDKETEVVVAEGKVILINGTVTENMGVVVRAGQMSKVGMNNVPLPPVRVNLHNELAWLDGSLVFDETPLRRVIADLERKYPFSFVVSDSSLLSRKLTASFKNEPFDEILKAVALSLNMQYKKKGDTILFERKNPPSSYESK